MAHKTDINRPFDKSFLDICRHRSFGSVLDDFTRMVLCCYSQGEQEELYLEIVGRYPKDEIRNVWTKLFGKMELEYIECREQGYPGWCDPFGQLYETNSSNMGKKMSGQFFTPPGLVNMMARITVDDLHPTKTVLVGEPACGSGRNVLAVARLSEDLNRHVFAECIDIDRLVAQTCAINMFCHGVRGIVFHGNALSMESWGAWHIIPEANRVDWIDRERAGELMCRSLSRYESGNGESPLQASYEAQSQLTLF